MRSNAGSFQSHLFGSKDGLLHLLQRHEREKGVGDWDSEQRDGGYGDRWLEQNRQNHPRNHVEHITGRANCRHANEQ